MRKYFYLAIAVLVTPMTANAQLMVMGGGDGRSCYEAAERGDTGRKSSIKICERALAEGTVTGKDRVSTLVNLGVLQMRGGNQPEALKVFDKAIEIDPDLQEVYINKGASLIRLGQSERAISTLSRSLTLPGDHQSQALYNRAIAYEMSGNLKAAYYDLLKAQKLSPNWELVTMTLERFRVIDSPVSNDGGMQVR